MTSCKRNAVKVLDKGFVALEDYMGSDLTVVNAARVSMGKRVYWECQAHDDYAARDGRTGACYNCYLSDKDKKLIKYLAKHKHWTPFGHPQVTLRFKMPVFVARQFMRSNVGIVYNETSRRYVEEAPEFFRPAEWRLRPSKSIKQGSSSEVLADADAALVDAAFAELIEQSARVYDLLLKVDVAPEMARMALLVNHYTEFWGTFSLAAAARVISLRVEGHAQKEIAAYGNAIKQLLYPLFGVSLDALLGDAQQLEEILTKANTVTVADPPVVSGWEVWRTPTKPPTWIVARSDKRFVETFTEQHRAWHALSQLHENNPPAMRNLTSAEQLEMVTWEYEIPF